MRRNDTRAVKAFLFAVDLYPGIKFQTAIFITIVSFRCMHKRLTVLLCFIPFLVSAQKITISATVVDKENKEALAFATVGIKNKPIGTVSNLQGEFDFHFDASYADETLMISTLGYLSFEAPIRSLLNRTNLVIEMERTTFMLKEVVVVDSLRGGDILQIALSKIENNFAAEPYMMDGFYRDIKKVGGTYISLLEAATKIYDEDYKAPRNKFKLRERVALMEVRRSLGYGNKFTAYFDEDNLLEDLLLHNNIKYRQFPDDPDFFYSLKRDSDSYYGGHDVFVLSTDTDYHLKLFIDKTNYGIIHLEYENPEDKVIGKRKGMVSRFVNIKKTIDFRRFNGKLYLNYISVDSKINWYDIQSNELRFETELHQQLLINDIDSNASERIGSTEKMRRYGLQYQDLPYNKQFWDNYNMIKESPLDRKIIDDLEKLGPLEKQFGVTN